MRQRWVRQNPSKYFMIFVDDTLTPGKRNWLNIAGIRYAIVHTHNPDSTEKPLSQIAAEEAVIADSAGFYTGPPGAPDSLTIRYAGDDVDGVPLVRLTWTASDPHDWVGNPMPVSRYNVYGSDSLDFAIIRANLLAQTTDTFAVLRAESELMFFEITAQDTIGDLFNPPLLLRGEP